MLNSVSSGMMLKNSSSAVAHTAKGGILPTSIAEYRKKESGKIISIMLRVAVPWHAVACKVESAKEAAQKTAHRKGVAREGIRLKTKIPSLDAYKRA